MEQYLKLFKTQADYESASDKPTVSHIIDDVEVKIFKPNNTITYWSEEKMPEVTLDYQYGLHTNAFNTRISAHTFSNGVGKVILYADVTTIGYYAFNSNSALHLATTPTKIEIPDTVTTIGDGAFAGTNITSMVLSDKITSVGNTAFADCTELVNLKLPSGLTTFGNGLVSYCTKLESITIPSGVTKIGNMSLMSCSSITTLEIPSGVTSMGFNAIYGMSSLESIICRPVIPPTLENDNIFYNTNNCLIYVPAESVNAYKTANIWRTVSNRIRAIS